MYLTQTNMIRHLTKQQYVMLYRMCQFSNNLYNVALYNIRQYYFTEKKFLTYESNYHVCKHNENYGLLQAGISQQILKQADRSFKSFFNLIKKARKGEYRFQDIKMPHYRKKGGLFVLVLSTNAIMIKDGFLRVPVSREFQKTYGNLDILIPVPERVLGKPIKEVRILPLGEGRAFQIQFVYEEQPDNKHLNPDHWLSIDLGVDNLAACTTDTGTSFLMDGRKLKSINQYWNKQKGYYQGIAAKQGFSCTKRLYQLSVKRNNCVKDIIRKSVRYIVNYCITHDIGTIVVGYNLYMKQHSNMGKRNNQNFVCIPHGYFRECLESLCERYGITYVEQEESYSSKASFKDLDEIPVYIPGQSKTYCFSGQRVKRGLYQCSDNTVINADINGSLNIMRKSKQNFDYEKLCRGLLDSPIRIRVS